MKTKKHIQTLFYIILCGVFTSTVLLYYSFLLHDLVPASNYGREYTICFGQILFQGSLLFLFKNNKYQILEYIKNMMTVSLLGGFLLLPAFIISYWFSLPSLFYMAYFFCVVLIMFINHKFRITKINAPQWLTYTWVLYRVIVLTIIL